MAKVHSLSSHMAKVRQVLFIEVCRPLIPIQRSCGLSQVAIVFGIPYLFLCKLLMPQLFELTSTFLLLTLLQIEIHSAQLVDLAIVELFVMLSKDPSEFCLILLPIRRPHLLVRQVDEAPVNRSLSLAHLLDDGLVIRGVTTALKHSVLSLLAGLHGSPLLPAAEQELVIEGEILGNPVVQVLDNC